MRRLIWVCTVCPYPTKRTLILYGLQPKSRDVASDVGVNLCNVKSCLTRQTMRFSQIREAIFLALIFLSTHAQL